MTVQSEVLLGDAREVLASMDAASVDAIVTDPPAGIGFMGVAWDSYQTPKGAARSDSQWDWQGSKERPRTAEATGRVTHKQGRLFREAITPIFAECLRVLKPGHQALVWALPRTSHWTATALEDAGFYVADVVTHHFGSGFPKSRSLLKPASEHWILCRAPGPLQPLQIDACRVGWDAASLARDTGRRQSLRTDITGGRYGPGSGAQPGAYEGHPVSPPGRWPPNLLFSHHPDCQPAGVRRVRGNGHHPAARGIGGLGTTGHNGQQGLTERHLNDEELPAYACVDGCPIKALDEQAGPRRSGAMKAGTRRASTGGYRGAMPDQTLRDTYGDAGAVSRFFPTFRYMSKASSRERSAGLPDGQRSTHPTVKPIALMSWLCTLITPPGGLVLDPFAGSGSTGVACVREGFGFIGIEMSEEYAAIARARMRHAEHEASAARSHCGHRRGVM